MAVMEIDDATAARMNCVASVIVPAHNEELSIGRLLRALLQDAQQGEFEIIVVCNGCTDETAEMARASSPEVLVLETSKASKYLALQLGERHCNFYPRLHVDADVVISSGSIRALTAELIDRDLLAVGPRRQIELTRSSWIVHWYYDIWLRLPQVVAALFGRGVIAFSEAGMARIRKLPDAMSDDLAASECFQPQEFSIVDAAQVQIWAPTTLSDLLRRRIRVATGVHQMDETSSRQASSRTGLNTLGRLIYSDLRLTPKVCVFMAVTLWARLRARRRVRSGDFSTWLRDESSRKS